MVGRAGPWFPGPGSIGTRGRDVGAVIALGLLGTAFLFEMVSMDAVPVARDIQVFFVPHKHILWDAFQRWEIPLWTPLVRTGYPVLANFQSGVFYLPHWLFGVLPFLTTFNLLVVGHLLLGGLGAYFLGRKLDLGPAAAWVAGASFMLGGYFVSLTNLVNALQAAAWVPVMAAVLLHHVQAWEPKTLALTLAVYLLGFLAGEPQTFVLGAVVALAVALVHGPALGPDARRARVRSVATMGLTAAAVAGLAAVQVLPTVEMLGQSQRGAGLTTSQAGRYSLSPVRLVHLLVPNDFSDPTYRFGEKMQLGGIAPWLFSVYVGVAALVAAWHARFDRRRRGLAVLWACLAAVGVVLALGSHAPVYPWLLEHVPATSMFRFPEKYFLFTGLAVPMLAGQGTEAVLRRPEIDRLDRVVALSALLTGLAARLIWGTRPDLIHGLLRGWSPEAPALEHFAFAYVEWGGNLDVLLGVLVAAVGVAALYRKGRLGRRPFVCLLLATVAVDFWVAHRELNPVVDPTFYTRPPAAERHIPPDERTAYRYRASPFGEQTGSLYSYPGLPREAAKWMWQQTMQPNVPALWDIASHGSNDAIHLEWIVHSDELLRDLDPDRRRRLLRIGSVKWVYRPHPDPGLAASRVSPLDTVPGHVHELRDPLPRAYLAEGRRFSTEIEALNWVLSPTSDHRGEVAIVRQGREASDVPPDSVPAAIPPEDSLAPPAREAGDRERWRPRARIVADEGERIEVRVEPEDASHLVLTDTWYPGWHAYVDGEERPLRRANYFFKAVRVRPGDETVVFRYRSEPFRRGALISGGAFVLVAAGLAGWAIRRRRERGRDGDDGSSPPEASPR